MNVFRNAFARRRIAGALLIVWLFAMGTGWANACLLQARGTHLDDRPMARAGQSRMPVVSAGHAGAVAGHDEDGANVSSSAACHKACADGSQSLVGFNPGWDGGDTGLAPMTTLDWRVAEFAARPSSRRLRLQPPIAASPIRLRFSRLTL